MSNDKMAERARFEQWYTTHACNYSRDPIGSRDCSMQWEAWDAALQAHAAEAAHPQPAQDASKYQELLMAVSKKFPNESRHETALRYIKQTELQSCEPKCDAAMAKESGR